MINENKLISASKAAKLVDESPQNFRHFINRGETPEPIKLGRFFYFNIDDILKWEKPSKKAGGARKSNKKSKNA